MTKETKLKVAGFLVGVILALAAIDLVTLSSRLAENPKPESIVVLTHTSARFSSYQKVKDQTADGVFRKGVEAQLVQYDSTGKWSFIVLVSADDSIPDCIDGEPQCGWVAATAIKEED